MANHAAARTQYVKATNGVTFAYRRLGRENGSLPLMMHIHFRANMDFWDPLLINSIAAERPVIIFDQAGVGRSDGPVANTIQGWADNVIAMIEALGLKQIDLLGFSMGGFTVQMVALTAPHLVRRLIIAGSGPSRPMHQVPGIVWPRDRRSEKPFQMLADAAPTSPEEVEEGIAFSFFPDTDEGRRAAKQYFERIHTRTSDTAGMEEPILSLLGIEGTAEQKKAAVEWHTPNERNSFHRLRDLKMPVLIVNGDNDVLIPTSHSWELLHGIENAQLIIYPKAGHGFCWQYAERVAKDVNTFLNEGLENVNVSISQSAQRL